MKDKKSINRGVRMTQEVYDYIMSFDEKGFNANLEKAVLFIKREVPDYKQKITDGNKELAHLNVEIIQAQSLINNTLASIQMSLNQALIAANKLSHKAECQEQAPESQTV